MSLPPSSPPLPTPRGQVWFLVAAAVLLLLSGSSQLPLIDRDEPRFAEATREMMIRHDWLVPTFNGDYRFDKPPLTYWAMALFYKAGGISELTARLHSILSTLALILVIYAAGRRWFSGMVGLAAGFGFLTSLQVLLHGRLSVADMPMVLAIAVAQIAMFELLTQPAERTRTGWFWTLYLALAAGFLAKGPIALAVPLGTALLYRFVFWRQPQPWGRLRIGWGLLLVLALVGLWGVPGLIETHGLWWKVGINEHVVGRGLEPLNNRHYFLPYYLFSSVLSLFPWIILVGYGALVLRRHWNATNAFLLSWFVTPYLIFTFYATQLPHYILPGFPAFFLILGQAVLLRDPLPRWPRIVGAILQGLFSLLLMIVIGVVIWAPWQQEVLPLREALIGLAAIWGGLLLLPVFCQKNRWKSVLLTIGLVALGFSIVGVGLRPLLPALRVAQIAAPMPAETRCVASSFAEGSLIFYTARHWTFLDSDEAVKKEFATPGPVLAVTLEREVRIDAVLRWLGKRLIGHPEPLKIEEEPNFALAAPTEKSEVSGINFARASWVTVAIWARP